jgi:2-octaprenyl-6-methoxyphenol hydroxylase
VFVLDPAEAPRLAALSDADMAAEIERRSHSILGKITVEPGRGMFPLVAETARSFGARRVALIGEAAHVLPPIGAQGLNLGLRDAAALADCVAATLRRNGDPGGEDLLEAYLSARRLDVMTRTLGVDLLSRALLTSLPPLQAARGIVLHGLNALGPLRRAVMRLGLTPPTELPSLMRRASG